MIEISITAKNEEKRLTHKHLDYSGNTAINRDNENLKKYVDAITREFVDAIDDIIIKIKFIW
jgi:hypothetical protein